MCFLINRKNTEKTIATIKKQNVIVDLFAFEFAFLKACLTKQLYQQKTGK